MLYTPMLYHVCVSALPLATQVDTSRQVGDVMGQRIFGIHIHGSVARLCQVEICRHCVSTWDWGVGNLKTCGQVVNAYQNDRVQDEDLTQKDYFLFRTHGTEQMPRSAAAATAAAAVLCVLRVSTVLCCCCCCCCCCCVLLFLLFYDGGGGEVSCCRVLCHFSNEVSPYA